MSASAESVKVAVRVRPFNQREIDRNAKLVISMDGNKTTIKHPDTSEEKAFTFDYSYWSHDGYETLEGGYVKKKEDKYADQQTVFQDLGVGLLENAWKGYNSCVFAYGQTGSGKSYSIVGYGENKGVIPMTCSDLFRRIDEAKSADVSFRVQVTMLEIYNEKLRDLLNPKTEPSALKIRSSASGTYVENIREVAVDSYASIEKQMDVGTKNRTVGATQMNATSSRAHTVFTIHFAKLDKSGSTKSELRAALNLVDLAGSERASSSGAEGQRLKEGAAINQSLSNLGLVISALAEKQLHPKKKVVVPYRASKLTMLLQNALGGNSKTVMVAALSPADINYEETLSTLRYADRAKQIKTVATVQENQTDKLIRELREENERLQHMVAADGASTPPAGALGTAGDEALVTPSEMQAALEEAVGAVGGRASEEEKRRAVEKAIAKARETHAEGEPVSDAEMQSLVREAIFTLGSLSEKEQRQLVEATNSSASWRSGGRFRLLLVGQPTGLARQRLGDAIARTLLTSATRKGALTASIETARRQHALEATRLAREQLEANQAKIAALQMSWEEQLESSKQHEAERAEALRSIGIEELTAEQMQTTPSLVNLSDDPLMSGRLMYWLRAERMTLGSGEAADIVLSGLGVHEEHCVLTLAADGAVTLTPVHGTTFVNGAELKGGARLEHNARLIIGSTNVLRFNDPKAAAQARAEGAAPKAVVDWDFAQRELSDALGATVSLKVEEEIAKEKAGMEAKAKELEDKFQAERAQMQAELERLKKGPDTAAAEREQQRLQELDTKLASVADFRKQREASIATYRRDLIRLEETLMRLNPVVGEANAIASQMGRKVAFTIKLVTTIPETYAQSPLEELWADKSTSVMVRATLSGHSDGVQRSWLWAVDEFYDRVFRMRDEFQLHLRGHTAELAARHTGADPFWAPPRPELLGKAYLYLTPLAHRSPYADWLPLVDLAGRSQGELRVELRCTAESGVEEAPIVADPKGLLGQKLHFTLRIDGARGLLGENTRDTFVRFNFSDEDAPRSTAVCDGRTATPAYEYKERFDIEALDEKMLTYLTSDAICFEVWGQPDEVAEGQAKAAAVEQPPEIFDFFVALDVHESATEVRGSEWVEAAWAKAMTRDKKPALYVTQNRARRLVVSVAQQQSVFMVSRFAHVWLGNLRDESHEVWDPSFIPLTISAQRRVGDRFEIVCEWFGQFEALNQASAAGRVFYLDVKLECTELERLVLDEPVILQRRLSVAVQAEPSKAGAGGVLGVKGLVMPKVGGKAEAASGGERRVLHEGNGMGIVADPDRLKRLEEHQQHYMGSWDITGEAIDIAMASLKSSAVADTGTEIKKQLHDMDDGLRQLSERMIDEQKRQLEVLSKSLAQAPSDAKDAIAERSRAQQEKLDATRSVLEETKLEAQQAEDKATAAKAEADKQTAEERARAEAAGKAQKEAESKARELEDEKAKLQAELEAAKKQIEQEKAAAATKKGGNKSSTCAVQ